FKETLPHLHVYPKHEPRIPFQARTDHTLIPDFITFLFRNYAYEEWNAWVERIWKQTPEHSPLHDPLPAIQNAFRDSKLLLLLNEFSPHLEKLRTLLHDETTRVSSIFRPLPPEYDLL